MRGSRSALGFVALALLLPSAAQGAVTIHSTGGSIEMKQVGDDVQVLLNGAPIDSRPPGADYVIQGADGVADTLTITNPEGGLLPVHVSYNGGSGAGIDTLNFAGGRSDGGVSTPSGPQSGAVKHWYGTTVQAIDYTGLEPLVDNVAAASATVNGTTGADTVSVTSGPGAGQITISSSTFESYTFSNKTAVTFDGMGGGDTVSINNSSPATGLTGDFTVQNVATVSVDNANYTGGGLILNATGAVTDSNAAANNVTADRFGALADSVGLDTQVANIEADTTTGSHLANTGDVTVGGVSASLHGLRVGGASTGGNGDANLSSTGSITLGESARSGFDGGSVTLTAGGGKAFATTSGTAASAPNGETFIQGGGLDIASGSTVDASTQAELATDTSADLNLGSVAAGAALSDAELDRVTAPKLVVATEANLHSVGDISLAQAKVPTLELEAMGSIDQSGGGISAQAVQAMATTGSMSLNGVTNHLSTLSGSAAGTFRVADQDPVSIGPISTTSGTLSVSSNGKVTVTAAVHSGADVNLDGTELDNNSTVTGTSGILFADVMKLAAGTVNVGTGAAHRLILRPSSNGTKIDLDPRPTPPRARSSCRTPSSARSRRTPSRSGTRAPAT